MLLPLLVLSLLAILAPAAANEFTEFRLPRSRVVQSNVRFSTQFERRMSDREYPNYGRTTSLNHDAAATYNCLSRTESDRQTSTYSLNVGLNESLNRDESKSRDAWYGYSRESLARRYAFQSFLRADADRSWYLWRDLFALSADASGRVGYSGAGGESSDHNYGWHGYNDGSGNYYNVYGDRWSDAETESWDQSYDFSLRAGPTFGRRRNVTPVADALVLEQRLIEDQVLSGKLTPANRRALAELLHEAQVYRLRYDANRWEKYFWADVEKLLLNDPACRESLGAYSLMRAGEGYLRSFTRYSGFAVSPYFSYDHDNDIRRNWRGQREVIAGDSVYIDEYDEDASRSHLHYDNFYWGIRFSYDVPISLAWHYSLSADFANHRERPFGRDPYRQRWLANGTNSLRWMIADRWSAHGSFNMQAAYVDRVGDDTEHSESWSGTLGLRLDYLIENHISLNAQLTDRYDWERNRVPPGYNWWGYDQIEDTRWTDFRLGLTYAFRGPLDYDYYYYYYNYNH